MPLVRALLRDTRNGKTYWYEYEDSGEGTTDFNDHLGGVEFIWTEGNYACDCNRTLFMYGESSEKCTEKYIELVELWLDDFPIILDNDLTFRYLHLL